MGEFVVIAVIAVLILGPERLPKALAEGARWLRLLREQAASARREIATAADLDPGITDDLRRSVADLADLHPRRLASSILRDPVDGGAASAPGGAPTPVRPSTPKPGPASGSPAPTGPVPGAAFDPDAT